MITILKLYAIKKLQLSCLLIASAPDKQFSSGSKKNFRNFPNESIHVFLVAFNRYLYHWFIKSAMFIKNTKSI